MLSVLQVYYLPLTKIPLKIPMKYNRKVSSVKFLKSQHGDKKNTTKRLGEIGRNQSCITISLQENLSV